MKNINTLTLLFLLSSCAKVSYLVEQGIGQLSLLHRAKDNKKLLEDPDVSDENKKNIRLIGEYKSYFYKYFNKAPTKIYSKTNILKEEAVTHLVIASPFDKVEAREECFPFVGCFPYLGFFLKDSAIKYKDKITKDEWITWLRPVYAYSTLGNFNDPILSSFFYYVDEDLAELIFHELFHTIFFVKNEVTLNENLANFFGEKMTEEYFNFDELKKKKMADEKKYLDEYSSFIIRKVKELNARYKEDLNLDKEKADKILNTFLLSEFVPGLKKLCQRFERSPCKGEKVKWNNARLAAYMTYEQEQGRIEKIYKKFQNLKAFLLFLETSYENYKDLDTKMSFSNFLFKGLKGKKNE